MFLSNSSLYLVYNTDFLLNILELSSISKWPYSCLIFLNETEKILNLFISITFSTSYYDPGWVIFLFFSDFIDQPQPWFLINSFFIKENECMPLLAFDIFFWSFLAFCCPNGLFLRIGLKNSFGHYSCSWNVFVVYDSFNSYFWL